MAEYDNIQLTTRPSISVMIPKGYEEKAKQLIDIAIYELENLVTPKTLNEHPYLGNPGILSRVSELVFEEDPVKGGRLQDILLLRIGIYANEQLMRSSDSEERNKALEVDSNLIKLVEKIEQNRP